MTFAHPGVLFLLAVPAALLALSLLAAARDRAKLARLVGAGLEPELLPRGAGMLRAARALLAAAGLAFGIAALAGPRLGETFEEARQKGRDVILAIDVSRSMLARDVPPDRLTRARLLAQDFLDRMRSDRIGIVAFAGTAFLQAPLTIDYGAVAATIQELDPAIIPRGGTNIQAAISEAVEAFGKAEGPNRLLVILSDGEELDANAVEAARAAREAQIRIDAVGIGTPEGDLIPIPGAEGQFVRGPDGEIVRTRLDESLLSKVAEAGGGVYRRFQPGADQAGEILDEAFGTLAEREGQTRAQKRPIERYQWPLSAALMLLTAGWLMPERLRPARPGAPMAAALALSAFAALAAPGRANAAQDPPAKLYADGKFEEAARAWADSAARGGPAFLSAFNRGCALYRAGKYDEAAEAFGEALRAADPGVQSSSHYNLGNALFRKAEQEAGEGNSKPGLERAIESLKNAIAQYNSALGLAPDHKEASHNRSVAEKRHKELEEQLRQLERQEQEQKRQQQERKEQKDEQKGDDQKQQQPGAEQNPKPGQEEQREPEQGEKSGRQDQGGENSQQEKPGGSQGEEQGQPAGKDSQQPGQSQAQDQGKEPGQEENATQDGGQSAPGGPSDQPDRSDQTDRSDQSDQSDRSDRSDQPDQSAAPGQPGQQSVASKPGEVPKIERDAPLEGEIRASGQPGQTGETQSGEEGDAVEEAAEADGKLSPAQARRLIESLRSEEQRVILRDRVRPERAFRDW